MVVVGYDPGTVGKKEGEHQAALCYFLTGRWREDILLCGRKKKGKSKSNVRLLSI